MDLKVEIGKKIKKARLNLGLTQAEICDDESELTIRQLARIENGQAMITVPKLLILSEKLGVSVQSIVDVEIIELPKEYLKLKQELINVPTYADQKRIAYKEKLLEKIYITYYDNLPEEEQLLVDVLQARLDILNTSNVTYGLGLLEEYFQQILKKTTFNVNDLLIIDLYFFSCLIGLENKSYFTELAEKVLTHTDYEDKDSLAQLEKTLLTILAQLDEKDTPKYIECFEKVMNETRHVFYRPMLYMMKAKYALHVEQNVTQAEELYDKAVTFAELLDDSLLVQRILEEKQDDFSAT